MTYADYGGAHLRDGIIFAGTELQILQIFNDRCVGFIA